MATKDWKTPIVNKDRNGIIYRHKTSSKKVEIVNIFGWMVQVPRRDAKSFKTKTEAMQFAKVYMRKH